VRHDENRLFVEPSASVTLVIGCIYYFVIRITGNEKEMAQLRCEKSCWTYCNGCNLFMPSEVVQLQLRTSVSCQRLSEEPALFARIRPWWRGLGWADYRDYGACYPANEKSLKQRTLDNRAHAT